MDTVIIENRAKKQLIEYITNVVDIKEIFGLQINLINPKYSILFMSCTELPVFIIQIIESYVIREITINIQRKIIGLYGDEDDRHLHIHFNVSKENSKGDKNNPEFLFAYCVDHEYTRYAHWGYDYPPEENYSCSVQCHSIDPNILTRKMLISQNNLVMCKYIPKFLNKILTKVIKFRTKHCKKYNREPKPRRGLGYTKSSAYIDFDDNLIMGCFDSLDTNIFFNRYLKDNETKTNNYAKKIISHNSHSVICRHDKKYFTEKCTRINTNTYEHVCKKKYGTAGTINYIITSHNDLIDIITINKYIYELINEQMKSFCNSNEIFKLIMNAGK